jgi:hypothetical protein
MSLGKTIIIMIVGKIGIRNDKRCCEVSFSVLWLYDQQLLAVKLLK